MVGIGMLELLICSGLIVIPLVTAAVYFIMRNRS
jgi:hypothetical protein